MADNQKTNTVNAKTDRRLLIFVFSLAGVGGVLVIFMVIAFLIAAPDLKRAVPPPAAVVQAKKTEAQASSTSAASQNQPSTATLATANTLALIPETMKMPESIRLQLGRLNGKIKEYNSIVDAFFRDEKSIGTYSDYDRRLVAVRMSLDQATNPVYESFNGISYEVYKKDPLYQQTVARAAEIRKILMDHDREACARFGKWSELGRNYEFYGKWDEAVYCWRKEGAYGTWRIVAGSVSRRLSADPRLIVFARLLPYKGPEQYRSFEK